MKKTGNEGTGRFRIYPPVSGPFYDGPTPSKCCWDEGAYHLTNGHRILPPTHSGTGHGEPPAGRRLEVCRLSPRPLIMAEREPPSCLHGRAGRDCVAAQMPLVGHAATGLMFPVRRSVDPGFFADPSGCYTGFFVQNSKMHTPSLLSAI